MRSLRSNKTRSLLLVGVWVNRNWILGNWVKEIELRSMGAARVNWTFSVFAQKHYWEKFVKLPLPKYGSYFFSYPSMFESYLKSNPMIFMHLTTSSKNEGIFPTRSSVDRDLIYTFFSK